MNNLIIYPTTKIDYISFAEATHPSPFQCNIEINKEQSSNEVNHINNIEYLRWIDKASQLHCDACNMERKKLISQDIMWFVARHEIDYCSEATASDSLRLTTWVEDVRRVKSWRTTYIHAIDEPCRVVCICKTLWVLVDLITRKPTSITQQMASSLQPLQESRVI